MNAKKLLANFRLFIESPNGIEKAKELILTLAFQGWLTDFSTGNSSDLLAKLPYSTKALERSSASARANPEAESIPKHWRWVSIRHVGTNWGQKKPSAKFSYIDVSLLDNARGLISKAPAILDPDTAPSRARKIVKQGTIIYSTVRPYLKNIAIIDRDFDPEPIASTAFAVVHPHDGIVGKFLYYYFRSPVFVAYVESVQSGIAYPAINDKKFYEAVVPLPPTDEQQRIVAKVDELMALCDKLEAQKQAQGQGFSQVSLALQDRLVACVNSSTVSQLFDTLDGGSVETIGAMILGLAASGSLSPQSIETEQVVIGDLVGKANLRNGLSPKRSQASGKYSCLPLSSMRNGEINFTQLKTVDVSDQVASAHLLHKGDVFIMRGNGSKHLVGTAAISRSDPENVIFPDLFIKITLPPERLDSDFFVLAWNSPVVRSQIEARLFNVPSESREPLMQF